jgi:hypothetical protein
MGRGLDQDRAYFLAAAAAGRYAALRVPVDDDATDEAADEEPADEEPVDDDTDEGGTP